MKTKEPSPCLPVDMGQIPMTLAAELEDWDEIPGYTEYFFWAEFLYDDGYTSIELVSILVEEAAMT